MHLSPELVDELDALLLFNVIDPQEGIKVHKAADPSRISAVLRLHRKGLITLPDGGYLTELGREALEQLHQTLTILTTA
ncbi:MAG: TIGR02647 family protein [Pseudomonadales bacterium]|nr:TIGR02647 family protein [Pseudomonadales bacterium]